MNELNQIAIARYFNLSEFQCPCCNCVILHPDLLNRLINLRKLIGEPIFINSAYRCKKENKRVGGVKKSYHTFGMAADISTRHSNTLKLSIAAKSAGFNGIGVYQTFVHVDIRPDRYVWEVEPSKRS